MSLKKYQIILLTDSDALNRILDELEGQEYVSFDIETNSHIEKKARVIGIGVTSWVDEGYYFPLAEFDVAKGELLPLVDKDFEWGFIKALCDILSRKKLIMHNGVYDINVMRVQYGIDLTDALYADTILLKHTVDEERPFGLKETAELYKEFIGFSEEEAANQEQQDLKTSVINNGGKWTQKQKDIYKGNLDLIGKYCCADVDLTLKLFAYFEDKLYAEGLEDLFYKQEVMPLYKKCTIPMKFSGVCIDVKYFQQLEKELERDILRLTDSVFDLIKDDIEPFVQQLLDDKINESKTGKFAERVLQHYTIPIPSHKKTGKPTLAKSALKSLLLVYPKHPCLEWLLYEPRLIEVEADQEVEESIQVEVDGVLTNSLHTVIRKVRKNIPDPTDTGPTIPNSVRYAVKKELFVESKPELPHVFNLASNEHLSWLVFDHYGETPKNFSRKTDKPQVDKDSLETYDHLPFIKMLLELKKQEKMLSTYVKPILETHINGWIYPSMLQFGTTSGRYSCAGGLNLQTLPRDDKRIKKGFIAPPGYKVVNADFASLEPRIFSWVCGDEGLKRVWKEGLDLYSQIAIDVFGLSGVSARESDKNYLKKIDPESRHKSKVFCIEKSTLVQTSSGWKKIGDVSVGDFVHTKFGFQLVTHTIQSSKPTIKLLTSKGAIVCTPDHKIWSESDQKFKLASEFSPGERLEYIPAAATEGVYQKLPLFSNASFKNGKNLPIASVRFDETWAWLLGAFLGDGIGSYTRRKERAKRMLNSHLISAYVGICGLEQDGVATAFVSALNKFGYSLTFKRRVTKKSGNFDIYTCPDFELVKIFQDTFQAFNEGTSGNGSKNLRIQPFVFNSPVSVQLAFIAGLFDTDGYTKANKNKKNLTASICSKSSEFATDIINLLRSMGVEARLQCSYNTTYERDYYTVCVATSGVQRLAELGIKRFMTVQRKAVVFDAEATRRRSMPIKVFKIESNQLSSVVDITVDGVHEFEVSGVRVHNCLAVPYGANEWRIAEIAKVDPGTAKQWISNYLESYPELQNYMMSQELDARGKGWVRTHFGRVRHLPKAPELYQRFGNNIYNKKKMVAAYGEEFGEKAYYTYRNQLNNARNFPIQATAAHVCNAALIRLSDLFAEHKIQGWIALQVHDEITCLVKENQSELASRLLKDAMEHNHITDQIDIPIIAEPMIADNFAEAK